MILETFSAAMLVKSSAKQYKYFKKKNVKFEPTGRMMRGNEWALKQSISPYIEMVSSFTHRDIKIYFTIDEIRFIRSAMYFYEYKYIEDKEYEDWFLKQSLIQTAFYGALGKRVNQFKSATHINGNNQLEKLPEKRYSRLVFGEKTYRVSYDDIPVLRFYLSKARAIANPDYFVAKNFDDAWKFKEWDWFKAHISYKRIN